mmetsp:Transcript_161188/g.517480  ORF Transcript_161188/g.517480 Transcript_161188/m.517480 type:complete len:728 (-) Transcript_161188:68-2251(-)
MMQQHLHRPSFPCKAVCGTGSATISQQQWQYMQQPMQQHHQPQQQRGRQMQRSYPMKVLKQPVPQQQRSQDARSSSPLMPPQSVCQPRSQTARSSSPVMFRSAFRQLPAAPTALLGSYTPVSLVVPQPPPTQPKLAGHVVATPRVVVVRQAPPCVVRRQGSALAAVAPPPAVAAPAPRPTLLTSRLCSQPSFKELGLSVRSLPPYALGMHSWTPGVLSPPATGRGEDVHLEESQASSVDIVFRQASCVLRPSAAPPADGGAPPPSAQAHAAARKELEASMLTELSASTMLEPESEASSVDIVLSQASCVLRPSAAPSADGGAPPAPKAAPAAARKELEASMLTELSASTMLEPDVSGVMVPASGRGSSRASSSSAWTTTATTAATEGGKTSTWRASCATPGGRCSLARSEALSSLSGIPSEGGSPICERSPWLNGDSFDDVHNGSETLKSPDSTKTLSPDASQQLSNLSRVLVGEAVPDVGGGRQSAEEGHSMASASAISSAMLDDVSPMSSRTLSPPHNVSAELCRSERAASSDVGTSSGAVRLWPAAAGAPPTAAGAAPRAQSLPVAGRLPDISELPPPPRRPVGQRRNERSLSSSVPALPVMPRSAADHPQHQQQQTTPQRAAPGVRATSEEPTPRSQSPANAVPEELVNWNLSPMSRSGRPDRNIEFKVPLSTGGSSFMSLSASSKADSEGGPIATAGPVHSNKLLQADAGLQKSGVVTSLFR